MNGSVLRFGQPVLLLVWVLLGTSATVCWGDDVVVGTLSAPQYNKAAKTAGEADYLFGANDADYLLTRVAVCAGGRGVQVAYMPASDGLAVGNLTLEGDKLVLAGMQNVQRYMIVDPASGRFLEQAPGLTVTRASADACAIWFCSPMAPALVRLVPDEGAGSVGWVEHDFPLPSPPPGFITQVCPDAEGGHVYLCCCQNSAGVRPSLYILDLGSGKWEVRPLSVQLPEGERLWDLRVLVSGDDGTPRLFGVTSSPAGDTSVVEVRTTTVVKVSPMNAIAYRSMPWAASRGEDGKAHLLYPILLEDHTTIALVDSHEANGSWRTTMVGEIGSGGRESCEHVCFPISMLASDGHLHLVYYSEDTGMVRQGVWLGGDWHVQDAFPAAHVTALAATEVDGKLAIVWADNKAQRVYARLADLVVTKQG